MGLLMMKVSSKAEIKDRIEKLYALAQGGATEGEAKAAIAMAEKLTVKYGITGINKNRYKTGDKGSRIGNATKSTGHYKTYTWDEYKQKSRKKSEDKSSKSDDGWDRAYRNKTFGQVGIMADVIRETEKAWLLNIYLEEDFYKGVYKASIWYPKSQVVIRSGNRWIVKEGLVMDNMKRNLGWLRLHHPAFRDTSEIRLKGVV